MSFSHIQGSGIQSVSTTTTATFGVSPISGNIICVGVVNTANGTLTSIKDGNGVNFTVTPNSPSPSVGGAQVWLAYLVVPSISSTTVVVKFVAVSGAVNVFIDEFSVNKIPIQFDLDVAGRSPSPGTTINVPTITPRNNSSLVYATAYPGTNITAPAAGATLGVWTGATGGILGDGSASEYILNQSASNVAVNFTMTSGSWTAMTMAFYPSGGPGGSSSSWLTVDLANSLRGLKH